MTMDGFRVRNMCKLFSSGLGMNCSIRVGEAVDHSCSQAPEPRLPTNDTDLVFVSPRSLPRVSSLKETETAAQSMINHPHQLL